MPRVVFVNYDGHERTVEGEVGDSLMAIANENGIDGILGECGGGCTCATCHCYIEAPWSDMAGQADPYENAMLDYSKSPTKGASRLSCQVSITDEMDGIIVHLPESQ